MNIWNWIRVRVRTFLGLDRLASLENLTAYVRMLEECQKRHHGETLSILAQIQQRVEISHFNTPVFSSPVMDWDTVQAMALASLQNDTKEHN